MRYLNPLVKNDRGAMPIILAIVISLTLATLLTSIYMYITNRVAWQTKIREAYRLNFVMEAMGKYVKDAYDRAEACRTNAAGPQCNIAAPAATICDPAGPAPNTYVGMLDGLVPTQHFFCFTPNANCQGSFNRLGINYTDSSGTQTYCLHHGGNILTTSIEPKDSQSLYAAQPHKNGVIGSYVIQPILSDRIEASSRLVKLSALEVWKMRGEKLIGDLGQSTDRIFGQVAHDEPSYNPEIALFKLIDNVYAQSQSPGGGPNVSSPTSRNYRPITSSQVPYTILPNSIGQTVLPTCDVVDPRISSPQMNCNRKCSPTMPCFQYQICPTWAGGACNGTRGVGKLLTGGIQLF